MKWRDFAMARAACESLIGLVDGNDCCLIFPGKIFDGDRNLLAWVSAIRRIRAVMKLEHLPYEVRSVIVKKTSLVTPHMKRLTIDSRMLSVKAGVPAQWLKIFVPVVPVAGGATYSHSGRAITVRNIDEEKQELHLDIFLHGATGPVSSWAETVKSGDEIYISDVHPRSGYPILDADNDYLLVGDETAMPAIASIAESLPRHAHARIIIRISSAEEKSYLRLSRNASVQWLCGASSEIPSTSSLESMLTSMPLPPDVKVWAAGESHEVQGIRRVLKARGLEQSQIHAAGYWKQGEADHRDIDA